MKVIRLVVQVLVGFIAGSLVNMGLVYVGPLIIPPPEGTDFSTMEGLKAAMPLMQPKHFLFPFLAHSMGTFAGASVAIFLSKQQQTIAPWLVGVLFFAGGLINIFLLPSPLWFTMLDLSLAYLPVAWLSIIFFGKKNN